MSEPAFSRAIHVQMIVKAFLPREYDNGIFVMIPWEALNFSQDKSYKKEGTKLHYGGFRPRGCRSGLKDSIPAKSNLQSFLKLRRHITRRNMHMALNKRIVVDGDVK